MCTRKITQLLEYVTISELEEIALEIEINLNNRPLTYVRNDIELLILTPNSLIYGHSVRESEYQKMSSTMITPTF